jgi:hypothetical protein
MNPSGEPTMKYFMLAGLLTLRAYAGTPLLVRETASGFVPPEYVFSKSCLISTDGRVEVTTRLRNEPPFTTVNEITAHDVLLIDVFLEVAAVGAIESLPVVCDAGSDIVNGYRRGKKIIVDEFMDCSSHLLNTSRTTPVLKEWAMRFCGF